MKSKPVLLVVLDGFGIRKEKKANAIMNADMDTYFSLWNSYPHTQLNASGLQVGVPKGQMGSSEIGHLTIGAGRVVKQPLLRINEDIAAKKFTKHPELRKTLEKVSKKKGNIHLMGLVGPGGVHAQREHLYALLDFYDKYAKKVSGKIYIHCFLDGRDTPPQSAKKHLNHLRGKVRTLKNNERFCIATLCGRYYAMDRDNKMQRTKKAFDLLLKEKGKKAATYKQAIKESYAKKITDEFLEPTILETEPIQKKDLCVFYNFRSDRPRQLVQMLLEEFPRLNLVTMTNYSDEFNVACLYPNMYPKNTFAQILAQKRKKQLRIAESEKFPHVTYFFSGLKFSTFPGEERIHIASPKVATYDMKPEMSAKQVTKKVVQEISKKKHDFILLNFANSDMVGHTGNYRATMQGLKTIDSCLKEIKKAIDKVQGTLIITADHGNAENMKDAKNHPITKHSCNRVPFILCDKSYRLNKKYAQLSLANVAPTLLEIMGISKPKEMSAKSLLQK